MIAVVAALASVALAALLGLAAYSSTAMVAAAVALAVLVLAVGWGVLLELPDVRGTAVVLVLTGAAGVATCVFAADGTRPLTVFAAVLALAVIAAFAHELVRRSRGELVVSVTGTLCGQLVALLGAGWILLRAQAPGPAMVVTAAAATAAAIAVAAIPVPARADGWAAVAAGAVVGEVAASVVGGVGVGRGAAMAVAAAGVATGVDRLLRQQPTARTPAGVLAAAAAPVACVGAVAYAVAALVPS